MPNGENEDKIPEENPPYPCDPVALGNVAEPPDRDDNDENGGRVALVDAKRGGGDAA